jgi:uncharacterized CHY-type Zn-finger protein
MDRRVGEYTVTGVAVGPETRCTHYDGETDVIALRLGCCEGFFACHACHAAATDHAAQPWPRERFDDPAVLCGVCATTLTARAYLDSDHACPACGASFNPGCASHYDLYFEGL